MSSLKKILYVDDEMKALKYFERFVGHLAPILTAGSVEEGKAMLREHGCDIAVLVTDQRMPGALGSELLSYARAHNPEIVRMLTSAYSELGVAIDAINSGEIYRYLKKPWETDSLVSDLQSALDLYELRTARDILERERLMVNQAQILANRLASLFMMTAIVQGDGHDAALYQFAQSALLLGCVEVDVDWNRWDHADLIQAEAQRGAAVASNLQTYLAAWGPSGDGQAALQVLAEELNADLLGDAGVLISDPNGLTALLTAPAGQMASKEQSVWLAWLLWQKGRARLEAFDGGYKVSLVNGVELPGDWLADVMSKLGCTRG